jgi:alpha(1,3/1,4) fucosyltransferase
MYIILLVIIIIFLSLIMNKTNKNTKRIQYIGFWGSGEGQKYFTKLLKKYNHNIKIVDDNPDIIIFSVFNNYHLEDFKKKDRNIKYVFYTGENAAKNKKPIVENINLNLTFQNTSVHNNIRYPLWLLYDYDKNKNLEKKNTDNFCCFVYSNDVKHRNDFCKKLSNYKKVDCGGGSLNNVGGKVKDKLEFQKKYKFCIAYENSLQPGYTTEKILEAYKSNCIPIYYGSETVQDDFNPDTFINAHDFKNEDELIEYIKKVDTDDELYNSYMNKPVFSKKWLDIFNDPNETFFKNVSQKIVE